MRWFFLTLVCVNVVLFAWFQQEQAQRERMAARADLAVLGTRSLHLLSESELALRERPMVKDLAKAPVKPKTVATPAKAEPKQCILLTGFEDETAVDALLQQLPHGVAAESIELSQEQGSYVVFLKVPENQAEAEELLVRLAEDGFEVEEAVADETVEQYRLGRYRSFELAQALFRALEQKHYAPDVLTVSTERVQPALQIHLPESASQADGLLDRLAALAGGFKTEKKSCQGVDSAKGDE